MRQSISIKEKWQQIPAGIRKMLAMGAIILIVWKALYTLWLQPNRMLDAPLTGIVATQTAGIMALVWPEADYRILEHEKITGREQKIVLTQLVIMKGSEPTISIADNCNGLELMILYIAFIALMPGSAGRKLAFIAGGIPVIHGANLLRCIGLVGIHLQWPGYFDFAHHYLFKIMVYAITFLLWMQYLKPITRSKTKDDA